MSSRERLDQQNDRRYGQCEGENERECHVCLGDTTRDGAEAGGLLLRYSSEGMERPQNERNGQSRSEDHPPKKPVSLAVVTEGIVHWCGRRACHTLRPKSTASASSFQNFSSIIGNCCTRRFHSLATANPTPPAGFEKGPEQDENGCC